MTRHDGESVVKSRPRALSGLSHFLHSTTESLPDRAWNIAAFMEIDGAISKAALTRLVKERLTSKFPRLRSVISGRSITGYQLVDLGDNWSPSRNIKRLNYEIADSEIERTFERVITEPFKPDIPEWEFIICPRESTTLIFARFNHSLLDGFSVVQLLLTMTDQLSPRAVDVRPLNTPTSIMTNLFTLLRAFLLIPFIISNLLIVPLLGDSTSPFAPYGKRRSPNAVKFLPSVKLHRLKQLARQSSPKATVNDALLGLIGGAVLRYMKIQGLPGISKLTGCFTANIRSHAVASSAELWGPTLGNRSLQFYCPIPTLEISTVDRISRVSQFTQKLKASPVGVVAPIILRLIEFFFALSWLQRPLTWLLMGEKYCLGKTFGLSNVPGPAEIRSLGGCPVMCISASVNLPQMFTAFSYNGEVRVVATLDRVHIDGDLMVQCFREELDSSGVITKLKRESSESRASSSTVSDD